jgi:hypothetical protein
MPQVFSGRCHDCGSRACPTQLLPQASGLLTSFDCILSFLIGQCIVNAIGVSDWSIVISSVSSLGQLLTNEI